MQAKEIKLGHDYAVSFEGMEMAVRVIAIVTTREEGKTSNSVKARLLSSKDPAVSRVVNIQVGDIIDLLENHQRLKVEQQRKADERKQADEARADEQWRAVQVLAKMLGAQAVKERYASSSKGVKWDNTAPAVMVSGRDIEINEHAIHRVLGLVERADTPDSLEEEMQSIIDNIDVMDADQWVPMLNDALKAKPALIFTTTFRDWLSSNTQYLAIGRDQ